MATSQNHVRAARLARFDRNLNTSTAQFEQLTIAPQQELRENPPLELKVNARGINNTAPGRKKPTQPVSVKKFEELYLDVQAKEDPNPEVEDQVEYQDIDPRKYIQDAINMLELAESMEVPEIEDDSLGPGSRVTKDGLESKQEATIAAEEKLKILFASAIRKLRKLSRGVEDAGKKIHRELITGNTLGAVQEAKCTTSKAKEAYTKSRAQVKDAREGRIVASRPYKRARK